MDATWAKTFAAEWIAAWNSHDLERILSHYTGDFEMSSPLIIDWGLDPSGTLRGKDKVRSYWGLGLSKLPDLHFELLGVFAGVNSIMLHYRGAKGRLGAEVLHFNTQGKVAKGFAHHLLT